MELEEAKHKFIQSWGSFGSQWGINRTMAQIHALFLIAPESMSTEDVMDALKISRGNTNTNIRTLIDWGLLYKEYKIGERREFFVGEKDIWIIAKRILKMRQQKELIPMLQILGQLQTANIESESSPKELEHFITQISEINNMALQADKTLTKISSSEKSWFMKTIVKLFT